MDKKLLFIYNPHAGKAQIKNKLLNILNIFAENKYIITAVPTQSSGDATYFVKKLWKEHNMIVCSGGDGTLNEVVTGMRESECRLPLGYIPAGSTNDFANSLKLPKNMLAAAQLCMKGKPLWCDIGGFNDGTFVYIAAFGAFTDVSYETKQEVKNVLGHAAYILEGMKRLHAIKAYPMTVECGSEKIEDEFIYGMVTNSLSVGGFKNNTGKRVLFDDGLFEVTLIKKPQNPIELQEIIAALLIAEFDSKYMYSFKTNEIHFKAEQFIPWTLDGEFGGEQKVVEINNYKQALPIIVDSDKIESTDLKLDCKDSI